MQEPFPNQLFDASTLRLLSEPQRWRIVANLPGLQGIQVADRRNQDWRQENCHAHAFPELLIALEGSVTCALAGSPRRCTPGTIILFAPGETHDNDYPPQTGPLRHLWCRIVQDHLFATVVRVARGGDRVAEWYGHMPLSETGVDFWRLWTGTREANVPAARRLHLQAAVAGILAGLISRSASEPCPSADALAQAITSIRKHLEETGGQDASLAHLAGLAGYSKYHFWRAFKAGTGMSLHRFIDRCRINKAVSWLGEGCSYKEIGERLGFSGSAAFSRWCRRYRTLLTASLTAAPRLPKAKKGRGSRQPYPP